MDLNIFHCATQVLFVHIFLNLTRHSFIPGFPFHHKCIRREKTKKEMHCGSSMATKVKSQMSFAIKRERNVKMRVKIFNETFQLSNTIVKHWTFAVAPLSEETPISNPYRIVMQKHWKSFLTFVSFSILFQFFVIVNFWDLVLSCQNLYFLFFKFVCANKSSKVCSKLSH